MVMTIANDDCSADALLFELPDRRAEAMDLPRLLAPALPPARRTPSCWRCGTSTPAIDSVFGGMGDKGKPGREGKIKEENRGSRDGRHVYKMGSGFNSSSWIGYLLG